MQKILIVLSVLYGGFCGISYATTVNYNWLVDGTNYAQTTCETGDDLILPTPTPTKYGYHFVGWVESEIFGSLSQSGIPTPQNPIEPVFKPFLNTVLRAVGSGDNFVADSYDPETRTIIRRIGVKVFDGTENFDTYTWEAAGATGFLGSLPNIKTAAYQVGYCSHYKSITDASVSSACVRLSGYSTNLYFLYQASDNPFATVTEFKQYLADQYAAGTPVTVYYPLATPQQESL